MRFNPLEMARRTVSASTLIARWDAMVPKFDPESCTRDQHPSGFYADVYTHAIEARNGVHRKWAARTLAIKVIKLCSHNQATFMKELELMGHVTHVACMEIFAANLSNGKRMIAMDRMPHVLDKLLVNGTSISENGVRWDSTAKSCTILGIAAGLAFLHSIGITHRDIKPNNILMDADYRPRIADFGLAELIRDYGQKRSDTNHGAIAYAAPELLHGDAIPTPAVDVYSFGLTVLHILTNEQPFSTICETTLTAYILDRNPPHFHKVENEYYQNLIRKCWSLEPEERGTMADILRDADKLKLDGTDPQVFDDYKQLVLRELLF
jgi:serine/threonine protein kinase